MQTISTNTGAVKYTVLDEASKNNFSQGGMQLVTTTTTITTKSRYIPPPVVRQIK